MQQVLKLDNSEGVATLALDLPEERNPLSSAMKSALSEALRQCASDASIGAVVITGNGSAFCSGGDVKRAASRTPTDEERSVALVELQSIPRLIAALPQVVIAAINGAAMGAGLGLACACDLRLASTSARFGAVFLRIGLATDFGLGWTLPRIVGPARARSMLLLGETLGAAQALEIGLVNRVVDPEELAGAARILARQFAGGPRIALAAIKRNLAAAETMPLSQFLQLEGTNQLLASKSEEHRLALQAYLQSRKASR